MNLDTYRQIVSLAAGFGVGLNLFVACNWYRLWMRSERGSTFRQAMRGSMFYPLMAAATLGFAVYFRLHDAAVNAPVSLRDLTVLVPVIGFIACAWVSLSRTAAVEILLDRLQGDSGYVDRRIIPDRRKTA